MGHKRIFTGLFTHYLRAIELGDVNNQYYGFYPGTTRFDMLTRYGDMIKVDTNRHPFLELNDMDVAHKLDGLRAVVEVFDGDSYDVTIMVPPFIFKNTSDVTL